MYSNPKKDGTGSFLAAVLDLDLTFLHSVNIHLLYMHTHMAATRMM